MLRILLQKIDSESFYAGYNVYFTKEWVLNNNGLLMHELAIVDALNTQDESARTVISYGKPIKYFYRYKSDEVPKYKNTKLKDEIYIYIIGYSGSIIDYEVTIQNRLKILRIFRCFGFIQYINL